jgi:Cache 3/Cache 2 fusion domain
VLVKPATFTLQEETHMGRINLIAWMLSVCFIALTPSVGATQTDNVKASMAALQAATGKIGAPKVQGSDLYLGNTKVSNDVVDAVVKTQGGAATLFVKSGDQFVRVATTLKKEDGTSAVGTALHADSRAFAKLKNGEAYYGDARIFGKTYDTGYEPIKDASGAVIGAYFVGYAK